MSYLTERDAYHPTKPTWTNSTTKYAAAIFHPTVKSLTSCVTWQRICYDKGWTGRNRLKGVADDATQDERDQLSVCTLCDEDECLDHILRYCLYKDLPTIRDDTIASLSTFITELHNDKTRSNYELLLAEAMREVATPQGDGYHEGWRAWTGQWTPALIDQLANRLPLPEQPSQDLCKRLRRISLKVGTILAQGARSIWAARCTAIAEIKYNRKQDEKRTNHHNIIQRNTKASKMPLPKARITAFYSHSPRLMSDNIQNPEPPNLQDIAADDNEPPTSQPILHHVPNSVALNSDTVSNTNISQFSIFGAPITKKPKVSKIGKPNVITAPPTYSNNDHTNTSTSSSEHIAKFPTLCTPNINEDEPPTSQPMLHHIPNFKKYSRRKPPAAVIPKQHNITETLTHAHSTHHNTCIPHKSPLEHRQLNTDSSSLVRGHID